MFQDRLPVGRIGRKGTGRGRPVFFEAERRDVAHVVVPGAGAMECIVGEPDLRIVCEEESVGKETVSFPSSAENAFLYESFAQKSRLLDDKAGWPEPRPSGDELSTVWQPLRTCLDPENKTNNRE